MRICGFIFDIYMSGAKKQKLTIDSVIDGMALIIARNCHQLGKISRNYIIDDYQRKHQKKTVPKPEKKRISMRKTALDAYYEEYIPYLRENYPHIPQDKLLRMLFKEFNNVPPKNRVRYIKKSLGMRYTIRKVDEVPQEQENPNVQVANDEGMQDESSVVQIQEVPVLQQNPEFSPKYKKQHIEMEEEMQTKKAQPPTAIHFKTQLDKLINLFNTIVKKPPNP